MTMYETKLTDQQERNEKINIGPITQLLFHLYDISIVPLSPINHIGSIQTNILLKIEENPYLSIKQLNITIIPTLQTF